MTLDWLELLKNFGIPAAGSAIGFIIGNTKAQEKINYLQTDYADFKLKTADAFKEVKQESDKKFDDLKKGWKLELGELKDDLEKKTEELKRDLRELDSSFDKFTRQSHTDFAKDDEHQRLVEEVNRQWQALQRTLGQIEGLLRTPPGTPMPPRPPVRPVLPTRR